MNTVKLVQEYERETDVNLITDIRNMFTNTFPAIRICVSIITTLVLYFFGTGSFAKTLEKPRNLRGEDFTFVCPYYQNLDDSFANYFIPVRQVCLHGKG